MVAPLSLVNGALLDQEGDIEMVDVKGLDVASLPGAIDILVHGGWRQRKQWLYFFNWIRQRSKHWSLGSNELRDLLTVRKGNYVLQNSILHPPVQYTITASPLYVIDEGAALLADKDLDFHLCSWEIWVLKRPSD